MLSTCGGGGVCVCVQLSIVLSMRVLANECSGPLPRRGTLHAPGWRCALSALKQDPAAQLDKRCARAYMQLGDVKLNAASAPIHSCWHPRPVAANLAQLASSLRFLGRRAPLVLLHPTMRHRCTCYQEASWTENDPAAGEQIGFQAPQRVALRPIHPRKSGAAIVRARIRAN